MIYMAIRQEANLALAINIKQWTNRDAKAPLLPGSCLRTHRSSLKTVHRTVFLTLRTTPPGSSPVICFFFREKRNLMKNQVS